jgi:hypothetical protein
MAVGIQHHGFPVEDGIDDLIVNTLLSGQVGAGYGQL